MTLIPLNPNIGNSDIEQQATRDGFGKGLVEAGQKDERVMALTGDLAESTRVQEFGNLFPARFVECGVAEQNMMGIAAGLALCGKIPFVSSYATFSPGRSWDQLRVSVCYSQANVKVVGAHAGISVGPDGATHQALEDIAITRVLPNITVVVPCDSIQAKKATLALAEMDGPAYIRLGREKTPIITTADSPFEIGKAQLLKDGTDVAVIATGSVLYNALIAALELAKKDISVMVINNHTVKPLDEETILAAAQKTGAVVTVEEHQISGGAGSAVAELLAKRFPVPVEFVGMPNSFGESGEPDQLLAKYGMDSRAVSSAIRRVLERKRAIRG